MPEQPKPFDDILEIPPARLTSYRGGLVIEWTRRDGTKTYRIFLHECVARMDREAVVDDIQRGDWVIYAGPNGLAWMGPTSVVLADYPFLADGLHEGPIPVFVEQNLFSVENKSWFDLATFFLAADVREAVRGDILETRAQMARRGYHRVWIETATAVEVARSLGASWSNAIQTVIDVLRKVLGN